MISVQRRQHRAPRSLEMARAASCTARTSSSRVAGASSRFEAPTTPAAPSRPGILLGAGTSRRFFRHLSGDLASLPGRGPAFPLDLEERRPEPELRDEDQDNSHVSR
jgi:hypothetical protein